MLEKKDQDAEALLSHLDRPAAAAQFAVSRVHFKEPETPNTRCTRGPLHRATPLRLSRQARLCADSDQYALKHTPI
jgi:hypothetical protein